MLKCLCARPSCALNISNYTKKIEIDPIINYQCVPVETSAL